MRSDGITNPGTSLAASNIMRPLITKENNPSVARLTGIDIRIKSGLIVWLMIARTTATSSAVHPVVRANESVEK
jgi:hypothetical protein